MKVINLTPNTIKVINNKKELLAQFEPSGTLAIARVNPPREVGKIGNIPIGTAVTFDGVENLPEPQEGVMYIVSPLEGRAVKDRTDVLIPEITIMTPREGDVISVRQLLTC